MTIYFTSDTHFGHKNILGHTGRPWGTVEQMADTLYVLGDFSYRLSLADARAVRERIACRDVRLVPGNHDRGWDNPLAPLSCGVFAVEPPIVFLKAEGHKLVLFHYPQMDWRGLGRGSIHLHGHIHADPAYNEWNRSEGLLRYDVGVDANGYAPVSLPEVLAFFDGVERRHRADWTEWAGLGALGAPDLAAEPAPVS
jgi:calcineurin-like phosphoesterase family protein